MNEALLNQILEVRQLPSLPVVAVRVLELAKQKDAGIAVVAKAISSDPALSAKVLKTVNSSFFAIPQRVSTINHALVLLGLKTVKILALGFSLVGGLNSKKSDKFDYVRFWRQSLFTAVAARALGKLVPGVDPEEAFLAGLLSDLGTMAMHRAMGSEYDALLDSCQGDQIELVRLSRKKFDLDHAEVGGALAERWKFPASLIEPIRQHHNITGKKSEGAGLVEVVHAGVLCGQVFASRRAGLLDLAKKELSSTFGLIGEKTQELFVTIETHTKELADLFEVKIDTGRTYQDVEEEARQTLIDLTLESQMQTHQALMQNRALQQQATTDGLTGLANRGYFAQFLAGAFAEASQSGSPLSLLFLDLDRFKSINDTHGHQAGDAALECIGKLIRSMTGPNDLAARYGGEEMTIALRHTDAAGAVEMAERIRQAIADERIVFGGKTIRITASIGVATMDVEQAYGSADEMIGAADRVLYSAKEAGRDRVRVCDEGRRGAA